MQASTSPIIPVETLLLAYRNGVFPMADSREDEELYWVEPKRRAIIPLDEFYCSSSLTKLLKQGRYTVTIDEDFSAVVHACAQPRADHPESWINEQISASYHNLHLAGHAHSIECWDGKQLIGGLYGVSFDRVFCGESMFSRASNTSKMAMAWLVALMKRAGFAVLDCQFMTEHLASLGAVEIPQEDYLLSLHQARSKAPKCGLLEAYSSLVEEADELGSSSPGKLIAQSFTQTS